MSRALALLIAVLGAGPAGAVCGDATLDGLVNISDALAAARHDARLATLTGLALRNADVSPPGGDGLVDVTDALVIASYSAGLVGSLSCPPAGPCPAPASAVGELLDTVVSYVPGPIINGGQANPWFAINGVRGGGCCQGSLDVCSLGSSSVGWGGELTLRLAGKTILDGPGPDLVVYENPFYVQGSPELGGTWETGVVSVSEDGVTWVTFPVVYDAQYPVTDRRRYVHGFCGVNPVWLNTDAGGSPGDPAGGGDAFDLAEIGLCEVRFVRIRDTAQVYPDANFPPGDCDIDGVAALYTRDDP